MTTIHFRPYDCHLDICDLLTTRVQTTGRGSQLSALGKNFKKHALAENRVEIGFNIS